MSYTLDMRMSTAPRVPARALFSMSHGGVLAMRDCWGSKPIVKYIIYKYLKSLFILNVLSKAYIIIYALHSVRQHIKIGPIANFRVVSHG